MELLPTAIIAPFVAGDTPETSFSGARTDDRWAATIVPGLAPLTGDRGSSPMRSGEFPAQGLDWGAPFEDNAS